MKLLHAALMAVSTYTILPVPARCWRDESYPAMVAFLPVAGLCIGAIWYGLAALMGWIGMPGLITAAVFTLCPHVLSGFFHLDGFMDVSDAVMSRRDLAERQRILKDSHVGAFAVIMVVSLFLVLFALWGSLPEGADLRVLILVPVCSRCVTGLSVTVLRSISTSQYNGIYKKDVKTGCAAALIAELAAALIVAAILGVRCLIPAAAAALFAALSVAVNTRALGGMSGDIAGRALTVGEAFAAAAVVAVSFL